MADSCIWNVQRWDQTLGVYLNLLAAKEHGNHVIGDYYRSYMDGHRVPASHRVVDWRAHCCGHLLGPGAFNHTAYPDVHAEGCRYQSRAPEPLVLRPFWTASGAKVSTGHVSTNWEIYQAVARDTFDPGSYY
ncbi:hypothetical protein [Streptomyces cucumeris]|uniref:hypothetical protein n=1 Tax=Streptomyces cucumeris TaxID=2962890 RepID=UPI0020C84941|nr:hypothetical protein [Streptomyces sp. NEAU-Y11]MCP9209632.1 hypothetical protein [Streptomyces sp. NEAU-Y11]